MKTNKQHNTGIKRDGKRLPKADRKAHAALRQSRRNAIKRLVVEI